MLCRTFCISKISKHILFRFWFITEPFLIVHHRIIRITRLPACYANTLYMYSHINPCCDVRYDFRVTRCSIRLDSLLFYKEFMFYSCYLYSLTYTGVQHGFHISWCSCSLTGPANPSGTLDFFCFLHTDL